MVTASAQGQVERWYREHASWLKDWLGYKLGCRHQAAELAHDTFVRLLKHSVPAVQPRAYLRVIARGLMVDQWRRQDLERAYLAELSAQAPAVVPSTEERYLIIDTLLQLEALLQRMRPRMCEVFLLAQLDNLTCPEIAARLGVSRATVERDLAGALRHCYELVYEDS